ncbi:LAMI_0E10286g1_1 [Lachancea mirantina]|uniref:LAMI_0E10286g1_1 n=1 Tax=Lachancea mirantina TaxID=1230905 RepID=A0A1G4JNW5_9SACH|nr:LAMI_0E10286g1_1 [Lachancea mirantina]
MADVSEESTPGLQLETTQESISNPENGKRPRTEDSESKILESNPKKTKTGENLKEASNRDVESESTNKDQKSSSEVDKSDNDNSTAKAPQKSHANREECRDESTESKEKLVDAKPKFVFGQSSPFAAGFGEGTSGLASADKTENKTSTPRENSGPLGVKKAAFGSGFAFGAGFGALNSSKPTSSDKVPKEGEQKSSTEEEDASEKQESSAKATNGSDGIVTLTKQNVDSGEEDEDALYQANAKLYQFEGAKEGWKERGVGVMSINKNRKTGKTRIVMRSRALLKVILNISLVKGTTVLKGFPASLHGDKFIRILSVDEQKHPLQYAVRVSKAEVAIELHDNIKEQLP